MIIISKAVMTLGKQPTLKTMLLLLSVTSVWTAEEVDAIIIPQSLHVEEGDYVQFKCLTTTDAHDIYWTKAENTPLLEHVDTWGSLLVIKEASIRDTGLYVCHTNSHRGRYQTSAHLIVTDKTTASVTPQELVVELGDVVELKCKGTGDEHSVHWTLKNGKPLPTSVKVTGTSLQIFSVREIDENSYICHVISTTGRTNASTKIIVEGKTTASIIPETLEIEEGQSAIFSCNVTGDSPQVYWHAHSKFKFSSLVAIGNGSILKITNASIGDHVKVHCKVVTSTGKADSTATLIVRERTSSNILPKEQLAKVGDRVKFRCLGTGHKYNITWVLANHTSLPSHARTTGSVLEIPFVTLNDSSEYICRLQSSTGISESYAKLTVKGNFTKQGHMFNLQNVQFQVGGTSNDQTQELVAPDDSYPLYVRILVVSSVFIACVLAFLFGFLWYSKCRKKKVKIVTVESLETVTSLLHPRNFHKRIHQKLKNRVHPMVVSDYCIIKCPHPLLSPRRARTAPAALHPMRDLEVIRRTSNTPKPWQPSQSRSSILSHASSPKPLTLTIPEVLKPDWSHKLSNSGSDSSCNTTNYFTPSEYPELGNSPDQAARGHVELPGTATYHVTCNAKFDTPTITTTTGEMSGSSLNTLQVDTSAKAPHKLANPKTKYGYIGFGPTGIYRGMFEVDSAAQFVPSLAALAMEKVKNSSIANTPSGLSFVPSTTKHSSMLEKRGQLEFVPSKKLASSTSVPSLSLCSSGNKLKKINSSLNLAEDAVPVQLVAKDVKRRVSFYDQYVLGCVRPDMLTSIHTDINKKRSLPKKSSLARKVEGPFGHHY